MAHFVWWSNPFPHLRDTPQRNPDITGSTAWIWAPNWQWIATRQERNWWGYCICLSYVINFNHSLPLSWPILLLIQLGVFLLWSWDELGSMDTTWYNQGEIPHISWVVNPNRYGHFLVICHTRWCRSYVCRFVVSPHKLVRYIISIYIYIFIINPSEILWDICALNQLGERTGASTCRQTQISYHVLLWMAEIPHQLVEGLSHYSPVIITSVSS